VKEELDADLEKFRRDKRFPPSRFVHLELRNVAQLLVVRLLLDALTAVGEVCRGEVTAVFVADTVTILGLPNDSP